MEKNNFAKHFDHTILKADASAKDVERICTEAKTYGFASVCVNSYYTGYVAHQLKDTDIDVCTVVGFPLGAMAAKAKAAEAMYAIMAGTTEIDMVLPIAALKDKNDALVLHDIKEVRTVCDLGWKSEYGTKLEYGVFSPNSKKEKVILKVIIETCLLTDEEKIRACRLAVEAGADFVKTSTGFSTGGATPEDVALMKEAVAGKAFVKASGGIRDLKTAKAMLEAGADRLGTSATVAIMEEYHKI